MRHDDDRTGVKTENKGHAAQEKHMQGNWNRQLQEQLGGSGVWEFLLYI